VLQRIDQQHEIVVTILVRILGKIFEPQTVIDESVNRIAIALESFHAINPDRPALRR
jgi:hypothetical protein